MCSLADSHELTDAREGSRARPRLDPSWVPPRERFSRLKVIQVTIGRDDCEGALRLLAAALGLRMEDGNSLASMEPLFAEDEGGLGRVEWEKHDKAEGIRNLLSEQFHPSADVLDYYYAL